MQLAGDLKNAGQFAMQGVAFLGGRGEPVLEEGGDELHDAARRVLLAEIEHLVVFEAFTEDHDRSHVRVFHHLQHETR